MHSNAIIRTVGRVAAFVLLGVFIAAVGEVQFSVFIRGDVPNLIGSMGFNALYLAVWAAATGLLLRVLGRRPFTVLLITALAGLVGLMIEWFIIGNSPWGNPDASNVGMFVYWACMVVVPLALLDPAPETHRLRRNVLLYGLVYTLLALAVQFIPNETIRYVYHIWSVILGYLGLLILTVSGLSHAWSPSAAGPLSPAA
jgi:hypothetical protein